ncbi:MAG: hypothetical protein M3P18_16465 [Actinomycetota bacterium]|nr:hypothetical protein [Actinomycetota bacterium]
MHDETYRMLGREHEADLERDARKWALAAEARGSRRHSAANRDDGRRRPVTRFVSRRVASFLVGGARAES